MLLTAEALPQPAPTFPFEVNGILDLLYASWSSLRNEAPEKAYQRTRVARLVAARRPIHIVLPAFPAKSPNPEKTIGALPDLGEVLALEKLEQLCRDIGRLYPPGARLTLCSDGRVFGDLVRVPDPQIDAYGRAIDDIIADFGLFHLGTYALENVFPGIDGDAMRDELIRAFAKPREEVRELVKASADARALFNGIHRFLFEDTLVLEPGSSRNQIRERTKSLAYDVIRRSNAWSELVEARFPDAIRLSIHPQPAASSKIGYRLLPSEDSWRTPWHSSVLHDHRGFRLVKRRDAEASGARLVLHRGKYGYFVMERGGIA